MSALGNIGGRLYRGEVSVRFVERKKIFYAVSAAILLISIAAVIFRGLNYSVEFKGGSVFRFTDNAATTTQITNVVTGSGGGSDAIVQKLGSGNSQSWQVQTAKVPFATQTKIQDAITSRFHLKSDAVSVNFVRGYPWFVYKPDGTKAGLPQGALVAFQQLKPVAMAGYSIYIYHVE